MAGSLVEKSLRDGREGLESWGFIEVSPLGWQV